MFEELEANVVAEIKKHGYTPDTEYVRDLSTYSVTIDFAEVVIPSLPCTSIRIVRSYDYLFEAESVDIFIDGVKNELTNEIGPDVFINDFILNKDIARFSFLILSKSLLWQRLVRPPSVVDWGLLIMRCLVFASMKI